VRCTQLSALEDRRVGGCTGGEGRYKRVRYVPGRCVKWSVPRTRLDPRSEGPVLIISSDRFSTDAEHVVIATGEIDLSTAPQLWEALSLVIEQGHREVVIDMAGVEFMDSQGVAVIVQAHKQVQPKGGTVILRSPPPQVRTVLEITGLAGLIQVES
jgi:anti-sigma B factor antagonist